MTKTNFLSSLNKEFSYISAGLSETFYFSIEFIILCTLKFYWKSLSSFIQLFTEISMKLKDLMFCSTFISSFNSSQALPLAITWIIHFLAKFTQAWKSLTSWIIYLYFHDKIFGEFGPLIATKSTCDKFRSAMVNFEIVLVSHSKYIWMLSNLKVGNLVIHFTMQEKISFKRLAQT